MPSSMSSSFNAFSHSSHQDFEHRRPAFFRDLDPRVVQVHDVHLERLHEKIMVVPAARAGQPHARLLFYRQ